MTHVDNQLALQAIAELLPNLTIEEGRPNPYIYRGEPECYQEVSSKLWRDYKPCANHQSFDIKAIQDEMVNAAKKHDVTLTTSMITADGKYFEDNSKATANAANAILDINRKYENLEILTKIQHYGGSTNLIDFTKDYFVALFFACNSSPNEPGRIISLRTENLSIRNWIKEPRYPEQRIIAQKSVFIEPPEGFIERRLYSEHPIPSDYKPDILEYLSLFHNISPETIYNDLHGFIHLQSSLPVGPTHAFHKGLSCHLKAELADTTEEKKKELYDEALNYYEQADNKGSFPFRYKVYNQIGFIYWNRGELEQAEKYFEKALGGRPDDRDKQDLSESYRGLGLVNQSKGNIESAIFYYNAAINDDPKNSRAYQDRAAVHYKLGNKDKAKQDITKAEDIELSFDIPTKPKHRNFLYP